MVNYIQASPICQTTNFSVLMVRAERLSSDHAFLRVDFYELNEAVFFGELTFYPASGMGRFTEDNWDIELGGWLSLPSI